MSKIVMRFRETIGATIGMTRQLIRILLLSQITILFAVACEFHPQPQPYVTSEEITKRFPMKIGTYYSPATRGFRAKSLFVYGYDVYIGKASVALFDEMFGQMFAGVYNVTDDIMFDTKLERPTFDIDIAHYRFHPSPHRASIAYKITLLSTDKIILQSWEVVGEGTSDDCRHRGGRISEAIACAMEDAVQEFIAALEADASKIDQLLSHDS